MEDRHTQITEGAGLQESRINTELIDWLNRWGTPILVSIMLVAGSYFAFGWWQRRAEGKIAVAWAEYDDVNALGNPSPASLLDVAREHSGVAAVADTARLKAANIYLDAVSLGVVPGGMPDVPEDRLTETQRQEHLDKAEELYAGVLQRVQRDPSKALFTVDAARGLYAVALSRGNAEQARTHLKQAIRAARNNGYERLGLMLEDEYTGMERIEQILLTPLYRTEDLPESIRAAMQPDAPDAPEQDPTVGPMPPAPPADAVQDPASPGSGDPASSAESSDP